MRFIQFIFICFVLIVGTFTALLGSHSGNQYIIKQLAKTELPLHLELKEGSILNKAHWQTIDWQGSLFQLSITDLSYDIDLMCLFSAEICVNKIDANAVSYSMALTKEPQVLLGIDLDDALARIARLDDKITNNEWQLNIPLLISVNDIDIRNINVDVANTKVTADRLKGAVDLFGRDIVVHQLATENVFVQVLTDSSSQASRSMHSLALKHTQDINTQLDNVTEILNEFELYQVSIPLRVDVKSAYLNQSKVQVNTLVLDFNTIDLIGFIDAGEVQINELIVDMPQADTEIKGQILLQKDYPVNASVRSVLKQPVELEQLEIDVTAAGSVEKINLRVDTSGLINTHINASLALLQPNLPFIIDATWEKLTWPLTPPAYIKATDGSLSLSGNLHDYVIDIAGLLDIDNAPRLDLDAQGRGNLQGLSLPSIKATTLGGNVSVSGEIKWVDGINVNSVIATNKVQLDKFWPDVKLEPSGDVAVDFELDFQRNNDWKLNVHDINVAADVEGFPLTLGGELTLNQDLYWHLNGLSLSRGHDSVSLDGIINERFKLGGKINVESFSPYLSDTQGKGFGYFTIIGKKDKPWLDFDLFTDNVLFKENKLKRADLTGRISLTERPEGKVSLTGETLSIGEQVINKIALNYTAENNTNGISLNIENDKNNAVLKIDGYWLNDIWQGRVTKGRINSEFGNWIIDPNVNFTFANEDYYLSIGEHCWNEKTAKFCLGFDGKLEEADNFEFELYDYDINKLGLNTARNLEVEGLLNIRSKVTWHKGEPVKLASKVNITDASLLIYNEEESSIANVDKLMMNVTLDKSALTTNIDIQSSEFGGMTADVHISLAVTSTYLISILHLLNL